MHELSIVFEIAKQVDKIAKNNNVKKVSFVTMQIGEVSMVVNPYLIDCWNWTRKKYDTLLDCELKIVGVRAMTRCEDCNERYPTVKYGKICPKCGSEHTYLLQGNEINIYNIGFAEEENETKN